MANLLRVTGMQSGYGNAQVLFGVDFMVEEGQIVTLLGRNGMGRSTTIKTLCSLIPLTGGNVELAGESINHLPSHLIAQRGVGLVPEGRQVFPNLTVAENLIATQRKPRKGNYLSPWTLDRVFSFFPRLKERSGNLGSQLSGGEQQMLAIGRALLTNPRLLILDEATEGLAPLIRNEIWRALGELKGEGLSMIVIDKNLGPLMKLADQHFVLEKGKVVWSGSSEELQSNSNIVHRYLGV